MWRDSAATLAVRHSGAPAGRRHGQVCRATCVGATRLSRHASWRDKANVLARASPSPPPSLFFPLVSPASNSRRRPPTPLGSAQNTP